MRIKSVRSRQKYQPRLKKNQWYSSYQELKKKKRSGCTLAFTFIDSSGTRGKTVHLCFFCVCVGASVIERLAFVVTELQLEVHQTDRRNR